MSFTDEFAASRRLEVLRLLRKAGCTAPDSVILSALRRCKFALMTGEELRADLEFFRKAGLVTLEWFVEEGLVSATLTDRGLDCAAGRIEVEGVERPERVG